MDGYACKHCPLAFEIGSDAYWDLSGGYSQYICLDCGTMHRVDHRHGKPDVLFAVAGPISAMVPVIREDFAGDKHTFLELPVCAQSWRRIGELPTLPELQQERVLPTRIAGVQLSHFPCSFCGAVGRLNWPRFGACCPKCGEKLEMVYSWIS
jgi:hypothetical protein